MEDSSYSAWVDMLLKKIYLEWLVKHGRSDLGHDGKPLVLWGGVAACAVDGPEISWTMQEGSGNLGGG